jgi:small subunit ribosomal protein S15
MEQESSKTKTPWLKLSEEEIKKIIAELMQKEQQPAKIGIILRDQYGVPTTKVYGKKLLKIMKELGYNVQIELKNKEKKVERMKEHLKENITDKKTKHKLQKAQSNLNIVRKYWKKKSNN